MSEIDFTFNLDALVLQKVGVDAAGEGDMLGARNHYDEAWVAVGDSDNPSAQLQRAMIDRDRGFLPIRAAAAGVEEWEEAMLGPLAPRLGVSQEATGQMLALPERFTPRALRQLHSEHGATVSAVGRADLYNQLRERGRAPSLAVMGALVTFKTAHTYLIEGSNGYFLASNAMHTARAERIAGNSKAIPVLLGQAGLGATAHRLEDVCPSGLTIVGTGLDLRSRKAAIDGVLTRP